MGQIDSFKYIYYVVSVVEYADYYQHNMEGEFFNEEIAKEFAEKIKFSDSYAEIKIEKYEIENEGGL